MTVSRVSEVLVVSSDMIGLLSVNARAGERIQQGELCLWPGGPFFSEEESLDGVG